MHVNNTTSIGFFQQKNQAETVKCNQHTLLLDQLLHPPGPIKDLLGPQKYQPE